MSSYYRRYKPKKTRGRKTFGHLAVLGFLFAGFIGVVQHQWENILHVLALTSVSINSGTTTLSSYEDLASSTVGLGSDTAAYNWTLNGAGFMELNIPFNAGATQNDFSGGGHNGSINGAPTFFDALSGSCQVGSCLSFDGVDDFVDFGNQSYSATEGAISLWFNPGVDTSTDPDNYIFARNLGGNNAGDLGILNAESAQSNKVSFFIQDGVSTAYARSNATNFIAGTWVHLVGVWEQNGEHALYINGVKQTEIDTGLNLAASAGAPFRVANHANLATGPMFDGLVDEVQLFKTKLSQAEITQLYNNGISGVGGPTQILEEGTVATQNWGLSLTPIDPTGVVGSIVPSGNTVTISSPIVTAQLNSGTTTLSSYSDMTANVTGLSNPQAAYTWTVDGGGLMALNIPFNSGGAQTDYSGEGNNGTSGGGAFFRNEGCKVGGCYEFDGVIGDQVVVPDDNSLDITGAFTISAWIKSDVTINSGTGDSATIAVKGQNGGGESTVTYGMWIRGEPFTSNKGKVEIKFSDGTFTPNFFSDQAEILADTWYHIVGTWDGTDNTGFNIYINGLDQTGTIGAEDASSIKVSTDTFSIGASSNGQRPFDGLIDEVQVFDRALSPSQVLQMYNEGNSNLAGPAEITFIETVSAEVWDLDVTPFDSDGSALSLVNSGNTVTIAAPTVTVDLNSGNSPLSTFLDLVSSVTGLATPQAAYTWTVDGNGFMDLNMPFNPGGTQFDYSGNGNDAPATNSPVFHIPNSGECQVGGCMEFNGTDSFVNLGADDYSEDNFSMSLWAKGLDAVTNDFTTLAVVAEDATSNACGLAFAPVTDQFYSFCVTSGAGSFNLGEPGSTNDSNWHHIVAVFSKEQGRLLYKDGVLVASNVDENQSTSDLALPLRSYIGRGRTGVALEYYDGFIDEVQFYPRLLTANEVTQIYNDGNGGNAGPTSIISSATSVGELWDLDLTPFDSDGSALSQVNSGNTVTINAPAVSVGLNNGVNSLDTSSVLTSQVTGLGSPAGAYRWEVDSNRLMTLNIPFNPGTTQTDYSGNNNDGTSTNGPVFQTQGSGECQVGGCMRFDGADDHIVLPAGVDVSAGDFTFASWVKTTVNSPQQFVIGFASTTNIFVLQELFIANGGAGGIVRNDAGSVLIQTGSGGDDGLLDGNWHHIAYTRNGTTYSTYVDGVLTDSNTGVIGTSTFDTFNLGTLIRSGDPSPGFNLFEGSLDEVVIADRAFSASQILQLYTDGNNGVAGPTEITSDETTVGEVWDLTGVWSFDSDGTVITGENSTNQVTIVNNTAPNAPILLSPADAETVGELSPTLSANYSDPDASDTGTTEYRVSSGSAGDCLSNTNIVFSGSSAQTVSNNQATTLLVGVTLTDLATYNWCARNNDGLATSNSGSFTTMGSFLVDESTNSGGGLGTILNQQNQGGGGGDSNDPQEEQPDIQSFGVDLRFSDIDNNVLEDTIELGTVLFGEVSLTNTNQTTALDVFASVNLPEFITYIPGSIQINGQPQSDSADDDPAQFGQTTVSAIWGSIGPSVNQTFSFQLLTTDTASVAAIELIQLQALVSASNAATTFSSAIVEFDLIIPDEVEEPLPEPEEEVSEPDPVPDEPVNEQSPADESNQPTNEEQEDSSLPVEDTPSSDPVDPGEQVDLEAPQSQEDTIQLESVEAEPQDEGLFLTGSVQSQNEQLQFSGTVNEPNSEVVVTINGQTSTVISDDEGFWQLFVSAEDLGIELGQSQQVEVEAIARKEGKESNTVVQQIFVERFNEELVAEAIEEQVSSNAIVRTVTELTSQAQELIEEQEEEIQATLTVVAPVVAVSSISIWGYLPYLPTMIFHLLSWLLGLFGRKKEDERFFGVVYDSISKQPVPLAIVRIYQQQEEANNRKLMKTIVTDKQGRYETLLESGSYVIEARKPQFIFPSSLVTDASDGEYKNVYQGALTASNDSTHLPDIPLDPVNVKRQRQSANIFKKLWMSLQAVSQHLAVPILFIGAIASVLVLLNDPNNLISWVLSVLYILMLIMQITFRMHPAKAWGMVYDIVTNAALPLTTLQLIDPEFGKIVKTRLSDYEGRFSFLPKPGKYVIKANKEGYTQADIVEAGKGRNPLQGEIQVKKEGERIDGDIALKQE